MEEIDIELLLFFFHQFTKTQLIISALQSCVLYVAKAW